MESVSVDDIVAAIVVVVVAVVVVLFKISSIHGLGSAGLFHVYGSTLVLGLISMRYTEIPRSSAQIHTRLELAYWTTLLYTMTTRVRT